MSKFFMRKSIRTRKGIMFECKWSFFFFFRFSKILVFFFVHLEWKLWNFRIGNQHRLLQLWTIDVRFKIRQSSGAVDAIRWIQKESEIEKLWEIVAVPAVCAALDHVRAESDSDVQRRQMWEKVWRRVCCWTRHVRRRPWLHHCQASQRFMWLSRWSELIYSYGCFIRYWCLFVFLKKVVVMLFLINRPMIFDRFRKNTIGKWNIRRQRNCVPMNRNVFVQLKAFLTSRKWLRSVCKANARKRN